VSNDPVNNPSHYRFGKFESFDVQMEICANYAPREAACIFNTLKYVARAPKKGKLLEDLKKAQWYLQKAIELVEGTYDAS
jgi:hypothetical protein